MATFGKFDQFVEYLAEQEMNLGSDQLVVGLTTNANAPSQTLDLVRADVTEIAYTNLSSRNVTTSSSAQSSGTYKLVLADLVLTASGAVATFRHVFLYDDTATTPDDPLIGRWDYGSDVTLAASETFTVDFDATNGVLQIV